MIPLLLVMALAGFLLGLFLGAMYGLARRKEIAHDAHHYAFHSDCIEGGFHRRDP